METSASGSLLKGVYYETCASEGHCPYYFGRDKVGGCRYFMVFRIAEGVVDGVDLSGLVAVYIGDLPHSTYAEVVEKGSEGVIYLSDAASSEQRAAFERVAVHSLGGVLMRKVIGLHYVPIEVAETRDSVRVTMPSGEMSMRLTRGPDGQPVRLENVTLPFLTNVKAAHAPLWRWVDYDKHFEYRDRCGTWAEFALPPG